MRTIRRRLLASITVLSLMCCFATVALWIRSNRHSEAAPLFVGSGTTVTLVNGGGRIEILSSRSPDPLIASLSHPFMVALFAIAPTCWVLGPRVGRVMTRISMMSRAADATVVLQCHKCGYDLRAQPPDGKCPECGESVAESRRIAAIPTRPAWRDSDPRWRRRMLAGLWVLVLVPLMDALIVSGWASRVPVPTVFDYRGTVRTIDETFLSWTDVYASIAFSIGIVLLFSKERDRRRTRLDWTRRWGVICSYVTLLLAVSSVILICALVTVGIAAIFHSMPREYQPEITESLADIGSFFLRYGPQSMLGAEIVQVAFSSIAILLACIPLFEALRSAGRSGSKRMALILLAPLALFALIHIVQVTYYYLSGGAGSSADGFRYSVYFWPSILRQMAGLTPGLSARQIAITDYMMEAAKWGIVLFIAVRLTAAQIATWRLVRNSSAS